MHEKARIPTLEKGTQDKAREDGFFGNNFIKIECTDHTSLPFKAYSSSGGGVSGRGVKRMEAHCIYIYEDSRMKPTEHWLKKKGGEGNGTITEGQACSRYTVHMHGIIMKSPHTISV
jgi:hypothetical protein